MENRKSSREKKEIDVRLYQGDTFVTLAKTQDLAAGGMFVHTNVMRFPKHSNLDIVLDSPSDTSAAQQRYSATVAHRCLNGIGISLIDGCSISEYINADAVSDGQAKTARQLRL